MHKINRLFIISLSCFVLACGDNNKEKENLFAFNSELLKAQYITKETIDLAITNAKNKEIDSVVYFENSKKIAVSVGSVKKSVIISTQKLGVQQLEAVVYFENDSTSLKTSYEIVSAIAPKLLNYKIIATHPHDMASFTEGLEFYKDTLFESTGQKGASYFRKYDYKTGKVFFERSLNSQYFGEGITIINNKLYQLTWQENTGFVYNMATLELEKTFAYNKKIEGWGLTNNGKNIFQSDGTEKIWTMDPATQKITDAISVYSGANAIKNINELEWIEGDIFANIFEKDAVAVIDPKTGAVKAIIDFSGLRKLTTATPADVLNGIAYNPKTKTIFVTGKNWNKMFEVVLMR